LLTYEKNNMKKLLFTALIVIMGTGLSFAQSAEMETAGATKVISLNKSDDGTYEVKSITQDVPATKSASLENAVSSKSNIATRATNSVSGTTAKPACSGAATKPACGASGAKPACCKSKAKAAKASEPN
jgi:hypothetical protein